MLGGYVGKILRVDLSSGTIRAENLPSEDVLRKYIGGLGLALKILYEELPLNIKPLDPQNRLIFLTGPLGGTVAPTSGQCCVASLNAETGYTFGISHFHGFFGANLKFAGYDGIIIQGAAQTPQYLCICDGQAELRDAEKYWGKDTHETEELIKDEIGEPEASVACIGPAGENCIAGASICTDRHHMAAKGGLGAIMGSKKLKAIVVWGTQGVKVHDPEKLLEVSIQWRKNAWAEGTIASAAVGMGGVTRLWYELAGKASLLAYKNMLDPEAAYNIMGKNILELAKVSKVRPQGSFNCPVACAYQIKVGTGPYAGYLATPGGGGENIEGASGLMGVSEPGTNYWLTDQFDRMGLDSATPGAAIALAFELYERGIITKKETDGLELKWGNAEAVYQLLQKVIKREGIGKILAEGPKKAAEAFGREAMKYVVHVKGTGWNMHDWRPFWGTFLSYGVATGGPCHQGIGPELVVEPDLGYDQVLPGQTTEGKAEAIKRAQIRKHWDDSVGICWFVCLGVPEVSRLGSEALAAATGWSDFTREEAWQVGERLVNLARLFNVRRGLSPADDLDYGGRLLEPPKTGQAQGKSVVPYLKDMLSEYYELMGWDAETGIPKPETLERLDLQEYTRDLATIQVRKKLSEIPPLDQTELGVI